MLHLLLRPRVPVLLAARSTRAASKLPNKDDVTPFSKEYTRSGTDDEIAQNKAAYDGSITNPVEEKAAVGREVREISVRARAAAVVVLGEASNGGYVEGAEVLELGLAGFWL